MSQPAASSIIRPLVLVKEKSKKWTAKVEGLLFCDGQTCNIYCVYRETSEVMLQNDSIM